MIIRKYEPRRATAEEIRRYFLQYHCDAPDALFGSAMEKELYLNAETPRWLAKGPRGLAPEQRFRPVT